MESVVPAPLSDHDSGFADVLPPPRVAMPVREKEGVKGTTNTDYVPPHKRIIAARDLGATLGGVVPPIPPSNTAMLLPHQRQIATVSNTDYVPPHKRIIAARDLGATPPSVAPPNDDEVEDYDDNDEILEDAYLDVRNPRHIMYDECLRYLDHEACVSR